MGTQLIRGRYVAVSSTISAQYIKFVWQNFDLFDDKLPSCSKILDFLKRVELRTYEKVGMYSLRLDI